MWANLNSKKWVLKQLILDVTILYFFCSHVIRQLTLQEPNYYFLKNNLLYPCIQTYTYISVTYMYSIYSCIPFKLLVHFLPGRSIFKQQQFWMATSIHSPITIFKTSNMKLIAISTFLCIAYFCTITNGKIFIVFFIYHKKRACMHYV